MTPRAASKRARAMWGMSRSPCKHGHRRAEGFTSKLEISGVGYRA